MFSLRSPKVTLPLPRPPFSKILDPPRAVAKPVIFSNFVIYFALFSGTVYFGSYMLWNMSFESKMWVQKVGFKKTLLFKLGPNGAFLKLHHGSGQAFRGRQVLELLTVYIWNVNIMLSPTDSKQWCEVRWLIVFTYALHICTCVSVTSWF